MMIQEVMTITVMMCSKHLKKCETGELGNNPKGDMVRKDELMAVMEIVNESNI